MRTDLMTPQDLQIMLHAFERAKIRFANRHWDEEAAKNYDRLLKMEEQLIIKYHLPDDALADCHCSEDDGCQIHQ